MHNQCNLRRKIAFNCQIYTLSYVLFLTLSIAILTVFAILARIHTEEVLNILNNDIREIQENGDHEKNGKYTVISPNENKLQTSQKNFQELRRYFHIWTCIGGINLVASIFLIYGICTLTLCFMVPWLIISKLTFIGIFFYIFVVGKTVTPEEYYPGLPEFGLDIMAFLYFKEWLTVVIFFSTSKKMKLISPPFSRIIINTPREFYTHTLSQPYQEKGQLARINTDSEVKLV